MWTTHWNVLTNGEAIMDGSMAAWPVDTYLPLAEEAIQVRNRALIGITMLLHAIFFFF